MTKFAMLSPGGEIDVIFLYDPRPEIAALEIPDDVFPGFVPDGAGGWAPPPLPPPSTADLRAHAAVRRFAVETGGIVVGSATIDTSRDSQSMIAGALAYVQASGAATVEFKAASGWVTLSAEQVRTIALAVAAHVQRCFAAERAADEAIDAGTVSTFTEIDAMIGG